MRMGLGIASAALVLLSACGGSGSDEPGTSATTQATPALDLLTTTQACAQVQMVNDETGGPGDWPIPGYGEYGEKTAPLASESVPEIADAIESMSSKATEVGAMSLDGEGGTDAVTQAAGEWAAEYEKVAAICARTDSPIARIDY